MFQQMGYVCINILSKMVRTGVIGTTQKLLDTIKNISLIPEYNLTGSYSLAPISDNYKIRNPLLKAFDEPEDLISNSDIIIISDHPGNCEDLIQSILKKSKHVLIFPDTSLTSFQLEKFVKLADEAGVFLFLYHEDLKNRIPKLIKNNFGKPEFIDIYRYLDLNDTDNIVEIFYEEIFLVMKLNPVNPRKHFTTSIPYYSNDPHLLNARIEFENGTSANITINKFEGKNKSRIDIFRQNSMASVHPETGAIKIIRKNPQKAEILANSDIQKINSQKEGLLIFLTYLLSGNYSSDNCENGISAHRIASEIILQLIPYAENTYF